MPIGCRHQRKRERLAGRADRLRRTAVNLARDIEKEFGKEHDCTIFARNVYLELLDLARWTRESPPCKK